MRNVYAIASLVLLSGCFLQGSLERLKLYNPQANDFGSALASEYLAYSESESELGHSIHAEHFAAKGLKAQKGETVVPDEPDAKLKGAIHKQIKDARERLLDFLTDDIKHVAPQKAARAQLLFDCWQHQQVKHSGKEAASCAAEFESAMTELAEVEESFDSREEMERILTFAEKETKISAESLQILQEIAAYAQSLPRYKIEMKSNPGGRGAAYLKIAEKRMQAARDVLVEKGVSGLRIVFDQSATDKTVYLSGDGEDQPKNTLKIIVKSFTAPEREET